VNDNNKAKAVWFEIYNTAHSRYPIGDGPTEGAAWVSAFGKSCNGHCPEELVGLYYVQPLTQDDLDDLRLEQEMNNAGSDSWEEPASEKQWFQNPNGVCEDAPCCGCCGMM
jgi:hypothetical protein